jgi:hypothetical protein
MEANTKYNIKDTVWLVNENKVVKMTVTGLDITVTGPDSHDVKYDLNYSLCEIPENKLFKTKEELLESL